MYRIFTKTFLSIILLLQGLSHSSAQSYYSNGSDSLAGGYELRDTIIVSGLPQNGVLSGGSGLDSVTLDIHCIWPQTHIITLISPNGTEVNLSELNGGIFSNFIGTNFNMNTTHLISELASPFTGSMRPDGCLERFNNGQNGNGIWQLKIVYPSHTAFSRVVKFGLHFNDSAETPYFGSSKLPIVVVNTKDVINPSYWPAEYKEKVNAKMGIIYNGPGMTNHLIDPLNHFDGNIRLNIRGATSADYPQKSFGVDIKAADHVTDSSVSLLGMPEEEDWILYAPWNDKSLVRNIMAYQLWGETGRYSPRTRLVELVLDGDHKGVYVLLENIKRGSGRIPISKLDADDTSGAAVTGGYIIKINQEYHTDSFSFPSNVLSCVGENDTVFFSYEYPKPENILPQQKAYIARYVDSFEQALAYGDPGDTLEGYRHFIDVVSFMDYAIMTELSNNFDAYRNSTFMYKPKNGKLTAGPIWDMNVAYGNCYVDFTWSPYTFRWDQACPSNYPYPIPFWWNKFKADNDFMHEFRCRYSELRSGPLSIGHITAMLDSLQQMLQTPQERHFKRWPILGRSISPNVFIGQTWEDDMVYLKNWFYNRIAHLDLQWYDAGCALSTEHVQPSAVAKMTLYPNPASEYLHVECAQRCSEVVVYNEIGQVVYKTPQVALKYDIDVREWSAGVYVVEVRTGSGVVREKVSVW